MNNLEALEGKECIMQYGKYNPYDGCVEIANRQPLVRCKDCKHFMPYSDIERAVTQYKDTDGICHGGYPRANDFFCADGEREE